MIFTGFIKIVTMSIDFIQKIVDIVSDSFYLMFNTLYHFKRDAWLLIRYFDIRDILNLPILFIATFISAFKYSSKLLTNKRLLRRNERYNCAQCGFSRNPFEWSRAITFGVRNAT